MTAVLIHKLTFCSCWMTHMQFGVCCITTAVEASACSVSVCPVGQIGNIVIYNSIYWKWRIVISHKAQWNRNSFYYCRQWDPKYTSCQAWSFRKCLPQFVRNVSVSSSIFRGFLLFKKKCVSVNNGCEGSFHTKLHRWRPEPFIIVMKAIMGPCKDCLIINVLFSRIPHKYMQPTLHECFTWILMCLLLQNCCNMF